MSKKILAIVEGEKKEVKLLERLSEIFITDSAPAIVSYKSSLYKLYNYLHSYGDSLEDLDVLMVLKEHEPDEEKKKLFDDRYTDVLLIFDFDPQDEEFRVERIRELMEFFNDSTDRGKLYINYPMIEAFYHLRKDDCDTISHHFKNVRFTLMELKKHLYKSCAANGGLTLDVKKMPKELLEEILYQHSCKARYIIDGIYEPELDFSQYRMRKLLDCQCQSLRNEGFAYVVSTCGFFVLENYGGQLEYVKYT